MMQIQTPAKINTQLHILNKRPDGWHEIHTHLIPVSLFDHITLTPNKQQGVRFTVAGGPGGLEVNNLIVQAIRAFEKETGFQVHLDVHLLKLIPVGAGLGGGSGNAAGVLQALNGLYQFPLKALTLKKLASELGADVSFFLAPCPSEAQGRGERVTPLSEHPSFFPLIVKPPFSISTATAYRHCQPAPRPAAAASIETFDQLVAALHNQFEATLLAEFPMLSALKQRLLQVGAVGALVSGSGSSVFGVFPSQAQQQSAYSALAGEDLGQVFCCHSLKSHCYF